MQLKNVLVLHKKSIYQIQAEEFKDERFLQLLNEGHESVKRVKIAHEEHLASIEAVKVELGKRGIAFRFIPRIDLERPVADVDMMISLGGDGTFLDASHFLDDIPILGVNSSSSSSFGHFCLSNADNFGAALDRIMTGDLEPLAILRLELTLNGTPVAERPLNEVLLAHNHPAATSRYYIEIDGFKEEQRSSGMWIATAAGSTGSLRSAGGVVKDITDPTFQYIVREPYVRPHETFKFMHGVLGRDKTIEVVSQMRTGTLYIDGQHIEYRFGLGDKLVIKASTHDLMAFVDPSVNDLFRARDLADLDLKR
jgi:NAD+ kinase